MSVSSIDFQQRRGVLADIIDEALAAYDQWYVDDDYDAKGALDRIMKRMRERHDLYKHSSKGDGR